MPTVRESFAKTFDLLLDIMALKTDEALKKIKTGGRTYIKTLIILGLSWIIGVPLLITLKAYTGIVIFSYAAAAISVILIVAILALWLPLGTLIGMLKGETINPVVAGASYVRKSAVAVFVGLLISLYAIKMPIENNPDAVPVLFVAVAALLVGIYLWGSWIPGKIYTLGLLALVLFTTISFFTPHPVDFILDQPSCNQPTRPIHQERQYESKEARPATSKTPPQQSLRPAPTRVQRQAAQGVQPAVPKTPPGPVEKPAAKVERPPEHTSKQIDREVPGTLTVELHPIIWSMKIEITKQMRCDAPGWVEVDFVEAGEKIRYHNKDDTFRRSSLNFKGRESKSNFPYLAPGERIRLRGESGIAKLIPI